MSISLKSVALATGAVLLSSGAAWADNCCGSGSFNGGITNIPVVTPSTGTPGCCGTVNSQIVAVPGVYVPSYNVGVNVGGTTIGGTNINVGGNTLITNGGSSYYGGSYYGGGSSGGVMYMGGGGGTYLAPSPVYSGMIEGLSVDGGMQQQAAVVKQIMETRTVTEVLPIRAVCMDDKGIPHPASRLDAEDKVAPEFNGEVYRCMAGTHMVVTVGRMVDGKAVFDGGKALECQKGQALGYKGGNMICVAQKAEKDCNERSLLRRFGPGIKYMTVVRTEQYATQKTVQEAQSQAMVFKSSMWVDGGVGQGVY